MTRAVILAAGQGTRLRPMTDHVPKCLVPLLGKPMLERQAATLRAAGITDITVATGYLCERIKELGFATAYNSRYAETNMVESLFTALRVLPPSDEDLIIGYGDIVYHSENLNAVLVSESDIALMIDAEWRRLWSVRFDDPLDDAETLKMDDAGYVTELGRKPRDLADIQGQYTGLIKIAGGRVADFVAFYEALDRSGHYDGREFDNMYMTSFLQALIDAGWRAKAALVAGGWLEVDSVEDLTAYEKLAAEDKLDGLYRAS